MTKDLGKKSMFDLGIEQNTLISNMEQANLFSNMQKDGLLSNIEQTKVFSDLEETTDIVQEKEDFETIDTEPFNYASTTQFNKGRMENASSQAG